MSQKTLNNYRRIGAVLSVALCLLMCGCSFIESAKAKLLGEEDPEKIAAVAGTWEVVSMMVDGTRLTDDEMGRLIGNTYYDFRADNKLVVNSPFDPKAGTWKVSGDAYELTIDDRNIEFKPENDSILLINGDTFLWLRRVGAAPKPIENTENTIKPAESAGARQSQSPKESKFAEPSASSSGIPAAGAPG